MKFKELVSPSLTDLFVKELERMILSGELKIGQKLPTVREMAKDMKVSLAVINGGITRLAANGFVRVVPRKGIYVADYIRNGNMNTLKALLEYSEDYFNSDILVAIVEFRKICELSATKEACLNRTAENLETLKKLLQDLEACKDYKECSEIAFKFHHEVSVASGNIVYSLIVATFKPIYCSSYHTMFTLRGKALSIDTLRRILEAIQNQDAETASSIVINSINRWKEVFSTYYHEGQKYIVE